MITVRAICSDANALRVEVNGAIRGDVNYRASLAPTERTRADTGLALTLLPAMRRDVQLQVEGETSSRLLAGGVPMLQAIFSTWSRDLRHVPVHAKDLPQPADRGTGVACFFSGGVDSFYTLLANREAITHLIFVHGYDLPLEAKELRTEASQAAQAVAAALSVELVEVETDWRRLVDPHVPWELSHGAMLASVGLLFQESFRTVLIASSHTYADLLPWGSHPLVDPLWSTGLTEFVHHGADATRIDKCRLLAENEVAMRHLRVCWENRNGRYNCGECEKCVRTMVNLAAVGALERCETLPSRIEPAAVAGIKLGDWSDRVFAEENLRAMETTHSHPALEAALRQCLASDDVETTLREQLEASRKVRAAIESSASWRLTRPLRSAKRAALGLRGRS